MLENAFLVENDEKLKQMKPLLKALNQRTQREAISFTRYLLWS